MRVDLIQVDSVDVVLLASAPVAVGAHVRCSIPRSGSMAPFRTFQVP